MADYFAGSWTGFSTVANSATFYGLSETWGFLEAGFTGAWGAEKQIAVELEIYFSSTAYPSTDAIQIRQVTLSDYYSSVRHETKSLAVSKQECKRFYQELDLYLTDSFLSIPIDMRAVPTITIDPADAFTSTGTTKDALIIKVDSSADNGVHRLSGLRAVMADEESKSLSSVSARVSALSNEVQKLHYDFEELRHATEKSDKELAADMASALMRANEKLDKYVAQEGIYHVEQDRKINELQRSINSLADDLKEPLEV